MYRALLAPSAVHELFDTLNSWGAWSARNLKEGQSPLEQLARGERSFSPMINAKESATGLAPAFEEHGEERRAVQLVKEGAWGGPLINPRLALREGLTSTGAVESEVAQTFELEGGELPLSDALKALGTGVYVSDLWYLNFSDKARACVTGTTRFATMWVENGEVVAPLSVMRFDDCLYDVLGERLEALSAERSLSVSTSTYGRRSLSSSLCPAALCSGLRFTL
jgi:predicted Zn-dependent protease